MQIAFQEVGLEFGGRSDPVSMEDGADAFVLGILPCAFNPFVVVIWGVAGASRLSNHSNQGLRPRKSRYSLTVSMPDGNFQPAIPQADCCSGTDGANPKSKYPPAEPEAL